MTPEQLRSEAKKYASTLVTLGMLGEHPNSTAYKSVWAMVLFTGGRETGLRGLSMDDSLHWMYGLMDYSNEAQEAALASKRASRA